MVDYPKDWEKVKLFDLMIPYGGLSGKSSEDFKSGNKKYISYLNVFNNFYIENITEKVNIKSNERQNVVNKGDIIFTQSSETLDEVGMTSTYLGEEEVYLNSFCFGARQKREFNSVFMVLLLRSKEIRKKISKEGQGSTRYNLSPNRLMSIKLVIPPLHEQKHIAETLMTFNRHIENLERLIEKKKMIRDGAVEDLMTGKTRLDGFNGEWEEVKLEDVCNDNGMVRGPFGGSLKKEYFVNKGYKVYEQRNAIYKSVDIGNYYIDLNKFEELKRFKLKENDFIISCSGTIGEIYQIPKKFKNGIINQALLKISINTNLCDLTFFKNYFSWEKFKSKIIDDTQGGAMKNLVGMDKFRKTKLYIPSDIKEQQGIADILTSMDEEIENLEKEKAKIEKIKDGAMDDLLTGKVRLI